MTAARITDAGAPVGAPVAGVTAGFAMAVRSMAARAMAAPQPVRHRLRMAIAALLVAVLLGGCGVKRMLGIGPPRPALRTLMVLAEPGANQGGATEVDIVVAYSAEAVATLPATGPDWFRQRAALRSALAKSIAVTSLEVPTPSAAFPVTLPKDARGKGLAVVAYANYAVAGGWPMVTLTPYRHPTLRLQPTAVSAVEQ